MNHIKLIICDIDNTLVQKHQDITARAKKDIEILQNHHVLFGLASGRSIVQLHQMEEKWGIRCDMLIGGNGSEIYDGIQDKEEVFYDMEPEWIKECFEIMKPFDTNPTVNRDGIYYVLEMDQRAQASANYLKNQSLTHVVQDISEFWEKRACKVGFRVKAEDMPAIEAHAAKFPSKNYVGFKTENTMFEFCNSQATKGNLLTYFCKQNHIDLKDVMSFGDMTNDISMLEISGIGVCMLNGSEDAKAASDIITEKGVEEEGWADFVEQHILIPNHWN